MLHDTVLHLYSTDGTTVLRSNDDFDGLASRVSWTAPSTPCLGAGSCMYFLMVSDLIVYVSSMLLLLTLGTIPHLTVWSYAIGARVQRSRYRHV